jgi:predicted nucleotide-binding protein
MTETTLPKLRVSREEAHQQIEEQIEKGRQLHAQQINSDDELTEARRESRKWSDYNKTLLLKLFDNESIAEDDYTDFNKVRPILLASSGSRSLSDELRDELGRYQNTMSYSINSLESIRDQLELYDEPSEMLQAISGNEGVSDTPQSTFGDEVFIVHGHDDEAKETVARFVENFGIEATILHEQANRGQTIPEKFEEHAGEAGFAIILLTPDDVGASQDEANNLKPRARQNVVLELGYFWGRLGRERVCVLYKEGVELPSDIHGILYVPMDSSNGWQLQLAKEMKQAGLPVDLNRLA